MRIYDTIKRIISNYLATEREYRDAEKERNERHDKMFKEHLEEQREVSRNGVTMTPLRKEVLDRLSEIAEQSDIKPHSIGPVLFKDFPA